MMKEKIYSDRSELDDFLTHPETALLNQRIYKTMLILREPDKDNGRPFRINTPALTIFNEAYFQATRITLDKHPEEDFTNNYFNSARDRLGSIFEAELTFSIVFLLLSSADTKTVKTANFMTILKGQIQQSGYFRLFDQIAEEYENAKLTFSNPFPPNPIDISNPDEVNWRPITSNFAPDEIAEAVTIGNTEDEQHGILDAIEKQCEAACGDIFARFDEIDFSRLRSAIVNRFNPQSHADRLKVVKGLNRAITTEKKNLETKYNELLEKYNKAFNELQKSETQNDTLRFLSLKTQAENAQLSQQVEQLKSQLSAAQSAPKSNITFSRSFKKIDTIRIFYVLHKMGKFQNRDGSETTLKALFRTVGDTFGIDLSDYSTNLSTSLEDSYSEDKHLSIFNQMKETMQDIFNAH